MRKILGVELMTLLTKPLLDQGLDLQVTLSGEKQTVELLDVLTGSTLAISCEETVEEAIVGVIAQGLRRGYTV